MARLFSGSGQYLSTASGITFPLTMAAWCRVAALPADNQAILVASNNSATNDFHRLKLTPTGTIQIDSYRSTGASAVTSTTAAGNVWFHAAAVVASATSRAAYLNGAGKGTNTTSKIPSGINATEIGCLLSSTAYFLFAGRIAEAAVWSAALTDVEIAALASGVPPWQVRPESIWGYWPVLGLDSPEPNLGDVAARAMTLTGAPTLADGPPVGLWVPPVREPALVDLAANAMPPAFVAAGTSNATTGSEITPAYPAGVAAGDLFILHCVGQGQTTNLPTVDAPLGWSTLYSSEGATNQAKQWLFARDARAVGTESGTVSVACTTPGTNGVVAGAIYAFRGVPPGSALLEGASLATGLSASIAAPAVAAGHARLCCAFIGVGGNQSPPELTGELNGDWTVRATAAGATGDGYGLQLQTTTAWNQTVSGGTAAITSDDWVVRAFALKSYNALVASSLAGAAPVLGTPTAKPALIGTPLVSRAPVLGQPAISQKHALAAINLVDAVPVLGRPAVDSLGSLTASSLADAASVLGQPAVGQGHALIVRMLGAVLFDDDTLFDDGTSWADDAMAPVLDRPDVAQYQGAVALSLVDRAPVLGQPTVHQVHALAATGLADRQPVLVQPVVGQKHALAATALVDQAPTSGQAAIGQKHALAATALADRAPVSGQPAAVIIRHSTASSLADQAPTLGQASIGQRHALAASMLADGTPIAGPAAIGQKHVLAAASLADLPPLLGQPSSSQTVDQLETADVAASAAVQVAPQVGQEHALAAASLATTPTTGHPTVGQEHALAATALAAGAAVLGQPGTGQAHGLATSSLAAAAALPSQPAIGQGHVLAAAALAAARATATPPALGQEGVLAASELEGLAPALATPIVGQEHVLAADALAATAPAPDQAALAQVHLLAADPLAGTACVLEQPDAATSAHGLAANDLGAPAAALEIPAVGQEHALVADGQATASLLGAPVLESFLPGVFVANDLDARSVILGRPKVNWRDINVIRFGVANTQAKVDAYGARPAYASAGAGMSSAAQFGSLAPLAPADVQLGDLLLWVAAAIDSDPSNVTAPSGYVTLQGSPFGVGASSYAPRLHLALKPATGADPGQPQSFNYALASGDATRRSISARVFRVTAADGLATSFVEGVTTSEGVTAGSATIICPPVAPAGVNRLGLIVTVVASAAGDTSSAGGIWQQAVPEYQSTTGGDVTLDLQWAALAREPSTGAQIPYGATGDAWVSVGFALAPPRVSIDFASGSVLIEDRTPALAVAVNG